MQLQGVCNHGASRLRIAVTMKSWRRLLFCLAVVTALYAFHVHLKTAKIFANPTWDAQDEVGQFWSEGAFQYRFAKFFASHPISEWGQLSSDGAVQHPDTIDDWSEFTVAMEASVVENNLLTVVLSPFLTSNERETGKPVQLSFRSFTIACDS